MVLSQRWLGRAWLSLSVAYALWLASAGYELE
jgi:hypothetical protein